MNLKEKYTREVIPILREKLESKNVMQIPHLEKIVLNMGIGEATQNSKIIDEAVNTLTVISGQKAVPTVAKKAISNFKLRAGVAIGAKTTLHGDLMWDFLGRLIHFALPRVKDFKGISNKGFDGHGNYTLGIKEQIIFLEVDYDKISKSMGMDISFVTSTSDDNSSRELLLALGMPFRKKTSG
ncbi:50S ribosomal protein L5 [Fibrobacterota bacterium]